MANTKSDMNRLVSHLSDRLSAMPEDSDFGTGYGDAAAFVMESIKATITAGERGRSSMTEAEKKAYLAPLLNGYVKAVRLSSLGKNKATAGRVLAIIDPNKDSGRSMSDLGIKGSFPLSETSIANDLNTMVEAGILRREKSDKGRTYYSVRIVNAAGDSETQD